MIEIFSQPSIIIAIIGFLTGILTVVISKFFDKKKDNVQILEQLSQNLWKEIGRLSEQIENLKKREIEAESRELELKEIIRNLQSENSKQTFKILQLEKEVEKLRNGNTKH